VGLVLAERPARGEAAGLLVLHHGRGTSEQDLIGLADVLDPEGRLHVACPRGPLQLPGMPGYHWYAVPRVGYPDPDTFWAARAALAETHDALWDRFTPEQTVLGGFSMGTVMSYTMAFDPERPAVAGVLAFSGFIPTVEGWTPELERDIPVFVAHGRNDPVISVDFARSARERLREVEYHESDAAHHIHPADVGPAVSWLGDRIAGSASA
jgi:phospholipase/carboxylesterase